MSWLFIPGLSIVLMPSLWLPIIFLVGWFFWILVGGSLMTGPVILNISVFGSIIDAIVIASTIVEVVAISRTDYVATSVTLSFCTWFFTFSVRLTISSSSNILAKSL